MALVKKILITGGTGFIGHHLVEHLFKNTDFEIHLLERFSHAGNLDRIADIKVFQLNSKRLIVHWHDLKSPIHSTLEKSLEGIHYIIHLAASTHVDTSLHNPREFVLDNVLGTCHMLDFARKCKDLECFINFSTDEVYGPAPDGIYHKETDQHNPTNPYAASKSGAAQLGKSYFKAFGLPVITTYTMNNFGERQNPEKFLPKLIRCILKEEPMPIYADIDDKGNIINNRIGSRCWLHARNSSDALLFLLKVGVRGEEYNVISNDEYNLVEMAEMVSEVIGKKFIPKYVGFYGARPGHDRRYALDGSKLKSLGWHPPMDFKECLYKTVTWSIKNPRWL